LSRIFALENFSEAFLHGLECLPVAARRHGIPLFAVALVGFRIPCAAADALDESGRDPVAFDRQRMIRVSDIGVRDALEVCVDIAWRARRFREAFDDRLAHFLPEQPQAVFVRRGFAGSDDQGRLVREGIVLPHGITGRRHRFHDIVRDAVESGVAEGPGQTSGDHRVTALKESGEKTGGVPYHRQHRADIRRVVRKIVGGARNQGRLHREQPQAGLFLPVRHTRQRDAKLQPGRAMREFGDLVARARRPRSELAGHGPVAGMKRKRLFRRQAPARAETRFQIRGTEAPEGRVPGRTVALYFVRAAWDIPALDDFPQEAVAQEALPVRGRPGARPDRPRPFRGLEVSQDFEGLREFFRGYGHSGFPSGFLFLLSDCVALYLYYCAVLLL